MNKAEWIELLQWKVIEFVSTYTVEEESETILLEARALSFRSQLSGFRFSFLIVLMAASSATFASRTSWALVTTRSAALSLSSGFS